MEVQRAFAGRPGVVVAAVLPGQPTELRALRERLGLQVTLLADPEWKAHDAYGFGRGGFAEVWLSPATWKAYARLLRRGWRPSRPRQDARRLGGDAIVAADGRLAWIHRSREPADRPSIAELTRQVDAVVRERL